MSRLVDYLLDRQKQLFAWGRVGIGMGLLILGVARLTNFISAKEELKHYFYLW